MSNMEQIVENIETINNFEQVDIPKVFEIYNDYVIDRDKDKLKARISDIEINRQPDNCTDCRKCMEKCPQSIDIPNMLSTILALVK